MNVRHVLATGSVLLFACGGADSSEMEAGQSANVVGTTLTTAEMSARALAHAEKLFPANVALLGVEPTLSGTVNFDGVTPVSLTGVSAIGLARAAKQPAAVNGGNAFTFDVGPASTKPASLSLSGDDIHGFNLGFGVFDHLETTPSGGSREFTRVAKFVSPKVNVDSHGAITSIQAKATDWNVLVKTTDHGGHPSAQVSVGEQTGPTVTLDLHADAPVGFAYDDAKKVLGADLSVYFNQFKTVKDLGSSIEVQGLIDSANWEEGDLSGCYPSYDATLKFTISKADIRNHSVAFVGATSKGEACR